MSTVRGSLRQRFLLVIVGAVVIPLGLAGWWLARQAVRSAEALLLSQLESSLSNVEADILRRWVFRKGDLLMLAENEVMLRTTGGGSSSRSDSAFLMRMHAEFQRMVPVVRVRSEEGAARWSFGEETVEEPPAVAFRARRQDERIVVTLPLVRDSLAIGSLEAEVRLSGVLPTDSMPVLVGGARLSVTDSSGGNAFVYPGLADVFPGASRFTLDNEEWLVARRRLKDPPIVLHLAAPITSFVAPYERAARIGLLVFALVVALAIILSSYLTRRITRPIEQLAYAADAVSGGNLDATVEVTGPGEIGTLSQSFASMLGSLRSTLQELSERRALATIGELSATLAHEVRNGLSSVRVDLQRLEETRGGGVEGNLARRALHNVERLNSTVTSTLAVARGGRVTARPVALNDVLAAAAIGAGPSFTAARAQLALRLARTESLLVVGDGAALEHLFLNLLINAAQAMPDGGTATVEVESLERSARVSVRDTGMGIDPGQLAKLSRPFSSTRNGGTGLGLAISRKIAEAHGGSIDFDSAPGLGTTVHVTLPLAAQ